MFFVSLTDLLNYGEKDFLDKYPALKNLTETVKNIPQIKKYLSARPERMF